MVEAEKNSLVNFLKGQVGVENEIVDSLEKALVGMKNPAVRGVLRGVSLDSVKHAELYNSAITLLTSDATALAQEDLDKQRALVEKHIAIEAKLIKSLKEKIPKIENEKVTFLLNAILEDECRHHAMLRTVLEIIVQGETITEDDWWKLLWEGTPFHGSPGGG
ncbi:ferritin-like domain-containing protein [Candidatus Bathycorpusculum sp.]|jgi:bacterioferritin (cytochrome b1)|uniref:ferritin-like domain-containing protein n=1 Tax=Candidatus Bathycorpusculum sp. TaxID=2994959 RepID=UPI0028212A89|nr:ferritin-like domain-containing protein [Candidatus Termitimicrobium sp.]MCL2432014.1 ferritin-like domain-containing protein [Candidatus Termitimicrobium sp.]